MFAYPLRIHAVSWAVPVIGWRFQTDSQKLVPGPLEPVLPLTAHQAHTVRTYHYVWQRSYLGIDFSDSHSFAEYRGLVLGWGWIRMKRGPGPSVESVPLWAAPNQARPSCPLKSPTALKT